MTGQPLIQVLWTDKKGFLRTTSVPEDTVDELVENLETLGLRYLVVGKHE